MGGLLGSALGVATCVGELQRCCCCGRKKLLYARNMHEDLPMNIKVALNSRAVQLSQAPAV